MLRHRARATPWAEGGEGGSRPEKRSRSRIVHRVCLPGRGKRAAPHESDASRAAVREVDTPAGQASERALAAAASTVGLCAQATRAARPRGREGPRRLAARARLPGARRARGRGLAGRRRQRQVRHVRPRRRDLRSPAATARCSRPHASPGSARCRSSGEPRQPGFPDRDHGGRAVGDRRARAARRGHDRPPAHAARDREAQRAARRRSIRAQRRRAEPRLARRIIDVETHVDGKFLALLGRRRDHRHAHGLDGVLAVGGRADRAPVGARRGTGADLSHTLSVRPIVIDDGSVLAFGCARPARSCCSRSDGQQTVRRCRGHGRGDALAALRVPRALAGAGFYDLLRTSLAGRARRLACCARCASTTSALIEDLVLGFGAGLNAVTGETGAGKSLLQRALAIAAGHRAGSEMVRAGCVGARRGGVRARGARRSRSGARLDALGIPASASGEIRIRRTIARNGRSQVVINDRPATVATLLEIGSALIHLQGQQTSRCASRRPRRTSRCSDQAAGTESEASRYRATYARLTGDRDASRRARAWCGAARAPARGRALRLRGAGAGEARARRRGGDADGRSHASAQRREARARSERGGRAPARGRRRGARDGAVDGETSRRARGGRSRLEDVAASLAQAADPLADAVRGLDYVEGLESDPQRLEVIEERPRAARAPGPQARRRRRRRTDRAPRGAARGDRELGVGPRRPDRALRAELARAADEAWRLAAELSAARRRGADRLAQAMDAEPRVARHGRRALTVRFEPLPPGPTRGGSGPHARRCGRSGRWGLDWVEFDLAANPGEGARPLARIASGGEPSRIMLALRNVAGGAAVPTLVFDEVDAGIGGATGRIVGRRLHALVRRHQVISITHPHRSRRSPTTTTRSSRTAIAGAPGRASRGDRRRASASWRAC